MADQTKNGKAFEYALLQAIYEKTAVKTTVTIESNSSYTIAKNYFGSLSDKNQELALKASNAAADYILALEPNLIDVKPDSPSLVLEIVQDSKGQAGDVRDVLAIRSDQNWEIGISAKNNHRAVKHQRLSQSIDFGKKWLGLPCSKNYFETIKPVFDRLKQIKAQSNGSFEWKELERYDLSVYVPILNAFKNELLFLNSESPETLPSALVSYLIGNKDFYKVIKSSKKVEVQAYNINGTLNSRSLNIMPRDKISKLKLPSKLFSVDFKDNCTNTLFVTLNEGWQISFRIHSASSRVEPSLKFDVNLVSSPHTLSVYQAFI